MRLLTLLVLLCYQPVFAATYYISPTGDNGNTGLTDSTPWATFAYANSQLSPGDTLILLDGTYTEQLHPTTTGTAGNPITYRAQNDYKAIIAPTSDPGNASLYVTSWVGGDEGLVGYLNFEGLIVRAKGENAAVRINTLDDSAIEANMTHHITMNKIGAFGDANLTNTVVFSLGNGIVDSTFTDIWAYGFGRKALQVFGAYRVTVTRAVLRYDYWDGASYKPNDPRTTFSGYNSVDCIFENFVIINTAETPAGRSGDRTALMVSGNSTPAAMQSSTGSKYLGSVVLDNVGIGLASDSGGDANDDITLENILIWDTSGAGININGNSTDFSITDVSVGGPGFTGIRLNPYPSNPITGFTIDENYVVDGDAFGIYTSAGQTISVANNTTVNNASDGGDTEAAYAPNHSPRFLDPTKVSGHERGATILNRYEDGVQTTTALWPWPDEDIIKTYMCSQADLEAVHRWSDADPLFVGKPAWCDSGKTLTKYVCEYNGSPCPTDICLTKHSIGKPSIIYGTIQ